MTNKRIAKIIEDLQSPEPKIRKKAAVMLGDTDARAVYPLIKTLSDKHPAVYEAAINSLIRIGGEVTSYMMLPLLRMDTKHKNAALLILKEIGCWEIIKRLLDDKDPYMRMFGLEVLPEKVPDEACTYIKKLLKDPSANVRAAAAATVAKVNCPMIINELVELLYDVEWVALSALHSLAILKKPDTVKHIVPLLNSSSEAVRLMVIECLGHIDTSRASKEALLAHFKKELSNIERDYTIKALINLGASDKIPEIKSKIKELLSSSDKADIFLALKAISDLRDTEFTEELLVLAGGLDSSNPENTRIIDKIEEVVLDLAPKKELCQIINSEKVPFMAKSLAIKLIGKLKIDDAFEDLLSLLKNKSKHIRRAAVRAISNIDIQKGMSDIISMLDDPDGHVRKEAVIALRNIKKNSCFEPIEELLKKEPYSDVMEEAIRTLLVLDENRFIKRLNTADHSTKMFIAQYSDSINVVLKLSYDKDKDVKISAITRLGSFKGKRVIKRIKEAIKDPSPEIRRVAIMSAYKLSCCKDDLKKMLKDEDEWVRYYALKVLKGVTEFSTRMLRRLLNDEFPPIVLETLEIIENSNPSKYRKDLEALLEHEDENIRQKAREILGGL